MAEAGDVGQVLHQRGDQAEQEHVPRQHQEDVADEPKGQGHHKKGALGGINRVENNRDGYQPDHHRGLGRVLEPAPRGGDGCPVRQRERRGHRQGEPRQTCQRCPCWAPASARLSALP